MPGENKTVHAAIPETLPVCIVRAGLSADLAKWLNHRFPGILIHNAATTDLLLADLERNHPSLLVIDGEKVPETINILGQLRQDKKFAQLPVFCCLSSTPTRHEHHNLFPSLASNHPLF